MLWKVNRYSYLITAALAMGGAWAVGARAGALGSAAAVAAIGLGMATVQRKLRGGASSLGSWQQVQQAIGAGTPSLLFLYSDT